MEYDDTQTFAENFTRCGITDPSILNVLNSIVESQSDRYTNQQLFEISVEWAREPYEEHTTLQEHLYTQLSVSTVSIETDKWFDYKGHMIYNTSNNSVSDDVFDTIKRSLLSTSLLMYHVTSWRGFKSIRGGINLSKSRKCLDFGQSESFYLTDTVRTAEDYIYRTDPRYKHEMAITLFEVPAYVKNPDDKNSNAIVLNEDSEWRKIIKYSRTCNKNLFDPQIENTPFIFGPMCSNPEQVKHGVPPRTHTISKNQLAVKKSGLKHIRHVGTIFYNKTVLKNHDKRGGNVIDDYSQPCNYTYHQMNNYVKSCGWRKLKRTDFHPKSYSGDWSEMHIFHDIVKRRFEGVDKHLSFHEKLLQVGATLKGARAIIDFMKKENINVERKTRQMDLLLFALDRAIPSQ